MNKIQEMTLALAQAAGGNPVTTTVVVILFYVMFNLLEYSIEKLIWGHGFAHFLDPIFVSAFIAYSAYAVYWCAVFNSTK